MKKYIGTIIKICLFLVVIWYARTLVPQFVPLKGEVGSAAYQSLSSIRLLVIVVAAILVFWLMDMEKPPMFYVAKKIGKGITSGVIFGIVWIGACLGWAYYRGYYVFTDIELVGDFFIWAIYLFLYILIHELILRGYIYNLTKDNIGVLSSMVITVIFSFLVDKEFVAWSFVPLFHFIIMNVLLLFILEYGQSLWACIIARFIFLFTGGMIFGLIPSLQNAFPHLMNASDVKETVFSGRMGFFENSVAVVHVEFILVVFLLASYLIRDRNTKKQ